MRYAALSAALALVACDPSAPPKQRASASAATSAAAAPASATASSPRSPLQKPGLHSPKELATAYTAELTETGYVALLVEDNSDASVQTPMRLIERSGDQVSSTPMPFSMEQLEDANLVAKRFLFSETRGPKKRVRVWSEEKLSEPLEDTIATGVVGQTQALVLLGKIDRIQLVRRADLPRAHRLRAGTWHPVTLPPPAEKDFAGCFWDAAVGPGTDQFVVLQICSAPMRELAYALFRLDPEADTFERIPFDNEVFDPVRSFRGSFEVEEDGTIDLGSGNPGKMILTRKRPGAADWKVITRELPTRLLSSSGAWADRVLLIDGGNASLESSDGGATFRNIPPLSGILTNCNRWGCALMVPGRGGASLYLW